MRSAIAALSFVLLACAGGGSASRPQWRSTDIGPTVLEFPPGEPAARLQAGDGDPCQAEPVTRAAGMALLAVDPTVDPHRPTLPPVLSRVGMVMPFLVRMCVSEDGSVLDVFVQKGDMLANPGVVAKLKSWRFKPREVDGKRVAFRFPLAFYLNVPDPAA